MTIARPPMPTNLQRRDDLEWEHGAPSPQALTTYDDWKTTNPEDEQFEDEWPCNWEKFSGICMVCGAGPDDECPMGREG